MTNPESFKIHYVNCLSYKNYNYFGENTHSQ